MRSLVGAVALAAVLGGCDPFHTGFDELEVAHYFRT